MDLAAGARRVVVLQSHAAKDGNPKLVRSLTLPATALGCAHRVITDLGVFDPAGDHFVCIEHPADVDREQIQRSTGAAVLFAEDAER
jgi:3-oxoacid CoA-transferase subunit B